MQTRTFWAVAVLGLWSVMGSNAHAQQATEQTVRELMELTGAGALGTQVIQAMLPGLRQMAPAVPPAFWDEFAKEIDAAEVVSLVVPIYQKHFTETELRELVRFYKTPTGQKLIRELPLVVQESMVVGQQWGQTVAQRAIARLQAQGTKLN